MKCKILYISESLRVKASPKVSFSKGALASDFFFMPAQKTFCFNYIY